MKKLLTTIYAGLVLMSLLFAGVDDINAVKKIYLNDPPHIPSNPQPVNGSTNVDVYTDLGWDGGDPDISECVYYDVFFGVSSNPPFLERIGPYPANQTRITYNPNKLNYNTQYYWRIDAWDSYGYSTTGPTWTFTTEILTNNPPNKPDRPFGPVSGMVGVSYSYSSSTTDPDGDRIYYMFDWGDGTTSGWMGPYESGQMVTSAHAWSMQGLYPIKVKAKDEHGLESVWSDPLSVSMPRTYSIIIEIFEKISHFFQIFGREIIPLFPNI